jgi:hypothetical protein
MLSFVYGKMVRQLTPHSIPIARSIDPVNGTIAK